MAYPYGKVVKSLLSMGVDQAAADLLASALRTGDTSGDAAGIAAKLHKCGCEVTRLTRELESLRTARNEPKPEPEPEAAPEPPRTMKDWRQFRREHPEQAMKSLEADSPFRR